MYTYLYTSFLPTVTTLILALSKEKTPFHRTNSSNFHNLAVGKAKLEERQKFNAPNADR